MAGFFGLFDYTKEGPGVYKDDMTQNRFFIFFEVLYRKFWKLITINLMAIPIVVIALFIAMFVTEYVVQSPDLENIFTNIESESSQEQIEESTDIETEKQVQEEETQSAENDTASNSGGFFSSLFGGNTTTQETDEEIPEMTEEQSFVLTLLLLKLIFAGLFVYMPVITIGPLQAGFSYIFRNYSREEHAFIWGDFKEHTKKNMKQGIIVSIINILFVFVFGTAFNFYKVQTGFMGIAGSAISLICLIILFMMSMYIYPMMVTFKLTVKQIYKNALLFAAGKFFPNILILAVCIVIIAGPYFIHPLFGFAMNLCLTFGLTGYIINFYTYGPIRKYMIDPILKEEEQKRLKEQESRNPQIERISEESFDENKEALTERLEDKGYEYKDGKLIKKDEENN